MSIGVKVEDMLVGCFCQNWALNIAVRQTTLKQKAEKMSVFVCEINQMHNIQYIQIIKALF